MSADPYGDESGVPAEWGQPDPYGLPADMDPKARQIAEAALRARGMGPIEDRQAAADAAAAALGIGTSSGSSPATSGMERAIATALSQPQGPVTSEQREQITQDIYDEAIGPINQMIYGGATPAQALSSRLSSMVGLTVFAAVVAAAAVLAWRHGTVTAPTVVLACALLVLEVVGLVRTRNGMDVRTKRRMWISLAWTFVMIAVPIVDLVGLIVVASHV